MSENSTEIVIKPSSHQFDERRGRAKTENPFVPHVLNSWSKRGGQDAKLGITMEAVVKNSVELSKSGLPANVVTSIGQIRDAAARLELGVRIETKGFVQSKGRKKELLEPDGSVAPTHTVIYFAAKERTKRTRKSEESDSE